MARYIDEASIIQYSEWDNDIQKWVLRVDIDELPTADVVEVKYGEWVHSNRGFDVPDDYECSICHSPSGVKHFYSGNKYSWCPDCGAKMDGGAE